MQSSQRHRPHGRRGRRRNRDRGRGRGKRRVRIHPAFKPDDSVKSSTSLSDSTDGYDDADIFEPTPVPPSTPTTWRDIERGEDGIERNPNDSDKDNQLAEMKE
jgi:hypothetical protein